MSKIAVILITVITALVLTESLTASAKIEKKEIISAKILKPKKTITIKRKFKPWNKPNTAKVFTIAKEESRKWGANYQHLLRRIECESTYRWDEVYAGHYGLGQFLPSTFQRGVGSIGTRKVVLKRKAKRIVYSYKLYVYSDGTTKKIRLTPHKQKVYIENVGRIPKNPEITHGWAQIRIMARAMVGKGNVSDGEWQCR